MYLDKDAKNEEVLKARHEQEQKLLSDLIKKKKEEVDKINKGQDDHNNAWKNHAELQKLIADTKVLRATIEKLKVED